MFGEETPKLICTECTASPPGWRQLLTAQKRKRRLNLPIAQLTLVCAVDILVDAQFHHDMTDDKLCSMSVEAGSCIR